MTLYNMYTETKLNREARDKIPSRLFGLPSSREFPIHDREHTLKAIQLFNKCKESNKKELANNIGKKAKEFGINISPNSQVYKYLDESVKNTIVSESSVMDKFTINENENYAKLVLTESILDNYSTSYPDMNILPPNSDNYKTLMITDRNTVVGYVSKNIKTGMLTHLKVNDMYRGQGIGTMLLHDINADRTMVYNKNAKLVQFFQKNGYEIFRETNRIIYMKKKK